jgi:hypothetical protein
MAVRLSALRAGHPLPPGSFLVLISVRGRFELRAILQLEGLGQLKKKTPHRDSNPFSILIRGRRNVESHCTKSDACVVPAQQRTCVVVCQIRWTLSVHVSGCSVWAIFIRVFVLRFPSALSLRNMDHKAAAVAVYSISPFLEILP